MRDFIQQLFSNGVDGRSVGRKLSALRHLYRHLLVDGKIDHDPTLNIDSPKQWKVLPKALARDEIEKTLSAPQGGIGFEAVTRDRLAGSGDAGSVLRRGAAGLGNCSSKT